MALPLDKLGTVYDERVDTIDGDRAKAYAAATNDDNPAYTSGKYAPPVFVVVPVFGSVAEGGADIIPPESLLTLLHGEQDIHLHQPVLPGMTLHSRATAYAARVSG